MAVDREKAREAMRAFLSAMGRDPDHDPELRTTADSVVRAWADELIDGYDVDVPALLAAEIIPAPPEAGLIVVRDLKLTTMCPHHLLPGRGSASVFYLPGASILGLGAIARLVDAWSHRLTLQETIGQNVASSLVRDVGARAAACQLSLTHACLTERGERQDGASVETLALDGSFREAGPDRDLFLAALAERAR
jgi:GTP cyclohydrolase I